MTKSVNRKPPISPQAMDVLHLIASSTRPLRARQIAKELNILPTAANRSLAQLMSYGLLQGFTVFPDRLQPLYYRCHTFNRSKRQYLEHMEKGFDTHFGPLLEKSHVNRFNRKE